MGSVVWGRELVLSEGIYDFWVLGVPEDFANVLCLSGLVFVLLAFSFLSF